MTVMRPLADDPDVPTVRRRQPPGLAQTALGVVPWAVLIGHAVWIASLAVTDGALLLAVLMLPWVSVIGLSRRWIRRFRTRLGRVGLDLALVTTCVVLVSLGGIWMLPGMAAFTAMDVIEPGTDGARRRAAFVLGGVILLAAIPGLLFAFIVWPAALVAVAALFVPVAPVDAARAIETNSEDEEPA
jgi:hypothetical protein